MPIESDAYLGRMSKPTRHVLGELSHVVDQVEE